MKNEEDTSSGRLPDWLKRFLIALARKAAGALLLLIALWCAVMFFYKPWRHLMIVRLLFLAAAAAFAMPGFNLFAAKRDEDDPEKQGSQA